MKSIMIYILSVVMASSVYAEQTCKPGGFNCPDAKPYCNNGVCSTTE